MFFLVVKLMFMFIADFICQLLYSLEIARQNIIIRDVLFKLVFMKSFLLPVVKYVARYCIVVVTDLVVIEV